MILFVMVPVLTSAEGETVLSINFEEQNTEGFEAREGTEALTIESITDSDYEYGLRVGNRLGTEHAAIIDVTDILEEGEQYRVETRVRIAPGEDAKQLQIMAQEELSNGGIDYRNLSNPVEVTDDEWVLLEGSYVLNAQADQVGFYIEEPYDEASTEGSTYLIETFNVSTQAPGTIEDIMPVKTGYEDYFHIGAAITPQQQSGQHGDLLAQHYNMIVAENIMKPDAIQPQEGQFNFDVADAMIAFAKENDMDVRFHTLVWHNQTADWMFNDANGNPMVVDGEIQDPDNQEANKQLLLDRMETHIRTVVERYAHDIDSWDVVNEVIQGNGYRESIYYLMTGNTFIHEAFRITRDELDRQGADGKIYYNDYVTHDPGKRDLIYDMIVEMIENDIPIDGMGHQTHIGLRDPSIALIIESIEKFASLGLDNQITELDVSIYTSDLQETYGTYDNIPPEILYEQALRYGELFEAFREHSDDISSVVFWGIGDDHTWLHDFPTQGRLNAPFIFDENLEAKWSYWSVMDHVLDESEAILAEAEEIVRLSQEAEDEAEEEIEETEAPEVDESEETEETESEPEPEENERLLSPVVWIVIIIVIIVALVLGLKAYLTVKKKK